MHRKTLLVTGTMVVAVTLLGCGVAGLPPAPAVIESKPLAHAAGVEHPSQPKRLEVVAEIDMSEFHFATPDGQTNPTIRLPAAQTIGLHLHNEGGVVHELTIGRKPLKFTETEVDGKKVSVPEGYETSLFQQLETDVFFYYSGAKAELGGAQFEELEIEPGIKDTWIRMKFPPELRGEWELGCFVPGHYEAGMRASLIVE